MSTPQISKENSLWNNWSIATLDGNVTQDEFDSLIKATRDGGITEAEREDARYLRWRARLSYDAIVDGNRMKCFVDGGTKPCKSDSEVKNAEHLRIQAEKLYFLINANTECRIGAIFENRMDAFDCSVHLYLFEKNPKPNHVEIQRKGSFLWFLNPIEYVVKNGLPPGYTNQPRQNNAGIVGGTAAEAENITRLDCVNVCATYNESDECTKAQKVCYEVETEQTDVTKEIDIYTGDLMPPTQNCLSADGKVFKCN